MESFFDNIDLNEIVPQSDEPQQDKSEKKVNSMLDEMFNKMQTTEEAVQDEEVMNPDIDIDDDLFDEPIKEPIKEVVKEEKKSVRKEKKTVASPKQASLSADNNGLCITNESVIIKSGCCIDGGIVMEDCKQSLMIHGNVEGDVSAGCIEIMGKIVGNIQADDITVHENGKLKSDGKDIMVKNNFSLLKGGKVTGNILCTNASVSGQVKGSISASGHLSISEGAIITGSIKASSIVIDEAVSAGSVILLKSADSHMENNDEE